VAQLLHLTLKFPQRSASAVVVPGRLPPSTSAWVTQFCNVWGLIPSCPPIGANAPTASPGPYVRRPLSLATSMGPA
jgi:hypothetical protein